MFVSFRACSRCFHCKRGLYNFCNNGGLAYTVGISSNGGWAQYCKAHISLVHVISNEIPFEQGKSTVTKPMSFYLRVEATPFCWKRLKGQALGVGGLSIARAGGESIPWYCIRIFLKNTISLWHHSYIIIMYKDSLRFYERVKNIIQSEILQFYYHILLG